MSGEIITIGPQVDQLKDFNSLSEYLGIIGSASKTLLIKIIYTKLVGLVVFIQNHI